MAEAHTRNVRNTARAAGAAAPDPRSGDEAASALERVTAILAHARESGLSAGKSSRISGRVSPELIARAKARTGITSDSALVEFALANIAIEDRFVQAFREFKGAVDPTLDLEF